MNRFILMDTVDVTIFGKKLDESYCRNVRGDKLFEIEQVLHAQIKIDIQRNKVSVLLTDGYFFPDMMEEFFSGEYKDRVLELEIRGKGMDENGKPTHNVTAVLENAKIGTIDLRTESNRIMSTTIEFMSEDYSNKSPLSLKSDRMENETDE